MYLSITEHSQIGLHNQRVRKLAQKRVPHTELIQSVVRVTLRTQFSSSAPAIEIQRVKKNAIHDIRTRDLSHRFREYCWIIPPSQHPARLLTPVAAGKSEAVLFGEFSRMAHAWSWLALTCLTPLLLLEIVFLTPSDIFALYFLSSLSTILFQIWFYTVRLTLSNDFYHTGLKRLSLNAGIVSLAYAFMDFQYLLRKINLILHIQIW